MESFVTDVIALDTLRWIVPILLVPLLLLLLLPLKEPQDRWVLISCRDMRLETLFPMLSMSHSPSPHGLRSLTPIGFYSTVSPPYAYFTTGNFSPISVKIQRQSIVSVYNGSSQESTQVGTLEGFGEVWFNQKSLANILFMAAVPKRFRITMDTSVDVAMFIHLPSGENYVL